MREQLWYILDGKEIRPSNMHEAALQLSPSNKNRIVGSDIIAGFHVSTVFLVIDHNHFGDGPPILFETMIFGMRGKDISYQRRCCTYEQAEQMHKDAIIYLKAHYIIPNNEGNELSTVKISPAGKILQNKTTALIHRLKKTKNGRN